MEDKQDKQDKEGKREQYIKLLNDMGLEEVRWVEAAAVMGQAMSGCLELAHFIAYGEPSSGLERMGEGQLLGLTSGEARHVVMLASAMFDKLVMGMSSSVLQPQGF